MAATTVSMESFKKNADVIVEGFSDGQMLITRPGKSTLVLLTADEYGELKSQEPNILEQLGHPKGVGEIDFEPPRMMGGLPRDLDRWD